MNIEHISVSRFQLWDQCKQAYKYKYHLKFKSSEPEPFYFVYGKIIHKIAEDYVGARGEKTLYDVAADVLQGRVPIERGETDTFAPALPPDYKNRLPEHLRSIKSLTDKIGTDGLLEYPFLFDLDPPHGKNVKGFIDRLIQKGDKWFIVDYKTTKRGKYRKDETTITHDLQLRMYARVIQRNFNVPAENISAALYYLEGGNLIAAKYTQASLDAAESQLLEAYNNIQAAGPDQVTGSVGNHCTRCDYRKICPFYNMV